MSNNKRNSNTRVPLTRATFLAVMSMLMTVAVAASLTFALFVNDVEKQHAKIQAGELDILATYVKLEGNMIDTDEDSATFGRLVDFTADETSHPDLDFGDLTDNPEYIFTIENAVPTLTQTATFEIRNSGNIAFNWFFSLDPTTLMKEGNGTDAQYNALINQIRVTMSDGNTANDKIFILADILDPAKAANAVLSGTLNPKLSTQAEPVPAVITVTVEFLNDADPTSGLLEGVNGDAQNGGCTFDILIRAEQTQ